MEALTDPANPLLVAYHQELKRGIARVFQEAIIDRRISKVGIGKNPNYFGLFWIG